MSWVNVTIIVPNAILGALEQIAVLLDPDGGEDTFSIIVNGFAICHGPLMVSTLMTIDNGPALKALLDARAAELQLPQPFSAGQLAGLQDAIEIVTGNPFEILAARGLLPVVVPRTQEQLHPNG